MTPTQPNLIEMPFAYNGGRNTIPAAGGEEEGSASFDQGFPAVTEEPVSQGGLPPQRKDFNGILYALSSFQFFAQAGGIYTYDPALDYRTPAMVWYANNLYICVKNNGPESAVVTPGTNADYWKDFITFISGTGSITADKLGTATVGGTAQGIWLNGGNPQAMSATVGSTNNGIWMDNGVLKACTGSGSGEAYITSTWRSGENWYRKYSDGFIEQGGRGTIAKGGGWISLPTSMTSTNYTLLVTKLYPSNGRQSGVAYVGTRETSRFWAMGAHQGGSASWDSYDCMFFVAGV